MGQMLLKFMRVLAGPIRMLITPKGQIVARVCAYSGFICGTIATLLTARPCWASPFLIACGLLPILGMVSFSHRRFAELSLYIWMLHSHNVDPTCSELPWQQSFVDGWQRVAGQPWDNTWLFWLVLAGGLLATFLIVPANMRRYTVIFYKVLYSGPVAGLKDARRPSFPKLRDPTQIIKICIWALPSGWWSTQDDHQRSCIYFDLKFQAAILGVAISQRPQKTSRRFQKAPDREKTKAVKAPEPAAFLDKRTGKIVVQPGWLKTVAASQILDLYIAVDYFASDIDAEAYIPILERLQEVRGAQFLPGIKSAIREIAWVALGVGAYWGLQQCSYVFFDGATFSNWFLQAAPILVAGWLVFKEIEIVIEKVAMKEQTVHGELVPAAMQPIAEQAGDD